METAFITLMLVLGITGALLLCAGAVRLADQITGYWRHARHALKVRGKR